VEIDLTRVLCRLDELRATGCREFTLGGGQWPLRCFVVSAGAGVHAYVNRCAHQQLPLNLLPDRFLTHDGSMILCTAHGAIFEKSSGYCVAGPCAGRSLAPVPVQVVAGYVMLEETVDAAALVARHPQA
jgi:nitrite reductase/ring-hydroxylating ferredoxin subunit